MTYRRLGRSELRVSALGLGCWSIGGPYGDVSADDGEIGVSGWGPVDDAESLRALARAFELGVNSYDTANAYGCGHSERLLGEAFASRREQVVIATKFGKIFDESRRLVTRRSADPDDIRRSCDESLHRLQTDYIDLYQFHENDWPLDAVPQILDVLDELVELGKIRYYGWSTPDPVRARAFAQRSGCVAIQHPVHMFLTPSRIDDVLDVCEEFDLGSIANHPLAMGILTGKFTTQTRFGEDDVRSDWGDLSTGRISEFLNRIQDLRNLLTADGRTLAQAALAWIWARSERIVPIPGFRTVAQVEENVGAVEFGPLDEACMRAVDAVVAGFQEPVPG